MPRRAVLAGLVLLAGCTQPASAPWVAQYGSAQALSQVSALAFDGDGNLYLAGRMIGIVDLSGTRLASGGYADAIVASFTPDGTLRWARRWGAQGLDEADALALDGRGHLHVGGRFSGTVDFGGGPLVEAGLGDGFLVELDAASGDFVSARAFGTPRSDEIAAVAADQKGGVVACGTFGGGTLDLGGGTGLAADGPYAAFVAAFAADGSPRWSRVLAGGGWDECYGLALGPDNAVTAAGSFEGTADLGTGPLDAPGGAGFVAGYTASGAPRFARALGTSVWRVAADGDGGVLATGPFTGALDTGAGTPTARGAHDAFVIALDAHGATRWTRQLGGATSSKPGAVAFAPDGDTLMIGTVEGDTDLGTGTLRAIGDSDIVAAVLAGSDGTTRRALRLGGEDFDEGLAIAAAPDGTLAIGGMFRGAGDVGTGAIQGEGFENGFAAVLAP